MLFKLLYYQDKQHIMSLKRQKLKNAPIYIVDDYTKQDRDKQNKWKKEVADAYRAGTFLHFSAGKWRSRGGAPAVFYRAATGDDWQL